MQNSRSPVEPSTPPLSAAMEHWQLLLEHCPGAIAMLDQELRYLLVSRRWRDEFQLGDRSLAGCSHSEVFSLTNEWWQVYTRCLTDGTEHYREEERVGVGGKTEWWQWHVACWRDGTGAIGGLILTAARISQPQQKIEPGKSPGQQAQHLPLNEALPEELTEIETALRESEHKYQQILDSISDMVLVKGPKSRIVWANRAFRDYYGMTNADLQGIIDAPFSEPDHTQQYIMDDAYVFNTGKTLEVEEPVTRHDSEVRLFNTVKSAIRNEDGQVILTVGVSRDTTDRNLAEKVLRQQEAQYRSIFEAVSDGLCITDLDTGKTVAVNPAMSRMHGYSEAEFLSLSPNHFVHPDSLPSFAKYLETIKARQPFYCQAVDIRKDGSLFDIEVNGTLCLYDGKTHGLAIVRDITEQQAARRDRKRANAQLREKEQFLRSIYDGVECAIFVVDVLPNGEFLYNGHNRAAEIRTRQRSLDVAGKSPIAAFGEAEGQAISQFFARCVMAKTSLTEVEQLTFDGETGWSMTTLNPLFDQNGKVYRIVGTSFDITDLKKTQAQLKQQAIALEQTLQELQRTQSQMLQSEKMSSLGQLVAGVAHEINNPVNFIFGNLKHANDYTQDLLELIELYQNHHPHPHPEVQAKIAAIDLEFLVEDLPKLLTSMKVGAERIQKIVASLRTFSRMDEAEMKEVDIHEGIDSTLMILQNRLKARHDRPDIHIIKQYGNLPLVECYAGQLNQVFMNILSNGIDALEEACLTHRITNPAITISTELLTSKKVRITIADNGLGMPEKVRQRLFDPFFTTKPVGKGTGMGLSISYQIVTEKHGGSLSCHSQPGQGAEFIIQIPLHQK